MKRVTALIVMADLDIDISISAPQWTTEVVDVEARCRTAILAAFAASTETAQGEVSILLSDDAQVRELNRDYRHQDKPTNVLSFANPEETESLQLSPRIWGDIVVALGVARAEAADEGKTLADHLSHLVVHGMLHLLGYDHEEDDQAEQMEALEIKTLMDLGIANPYEDNEQVNAQ